MRTGRVLSPDLSLFIFTFELVGGARQSLADMGTGKDGFAYGLRFLSR